MAQPASYTVLNKEGVDLGAVYTNTASLTPETPSPPFAIGEEVIGNNGSQWIFCQASTSITANDWVAITGAGQANSMTSTNIAASGGVRIGVSPVTALAGNYFWAAINSTKMTAQLGAASNQGVLLYATAVAGVVSSVSTSGPAILGIVVVTSNSSLAASAGTVTMTWPRLGQPSLLGGGTGLI
jgi:hypothetical protein